MSNEVQQFMQIVRNTADAVLTRFCPRCGEKTEHISTIEEDWETLTCQECGTARTYKVR